ncbi:MAG: PD-(D/E)XK nuclease family protein [Verrucomicrobiaceae bacterium]|nr:PD-(D/E)XK nuclease family protein [Verrucomicrobiaceae bacterium]
MTASRRVASHHAEGEVLRPTIRLRVISFGGEGGMGVVPAKTGRIFNVHSTLRVLLLGSAKRMPRKSRTTDSEQSQLGLFAARARPDESSTPTEQVDERLTLAREPVVTRRFAGWDKPLLQSAAEHLAADWQGRGALDLSDWLVVVPTRHAGRRLREALATLAATRDAAVLPPQTVTPDFLTAPQRVAGIQVAGPVETLLIWAGELLRLDPGEFRQLFPVDPVERNFTWALRTAGDLLQVRETLNESGLSVADVAHRLAGTEMEPERWRDFARLEQHCVRETEARGFADWQGARRRAAAVGELPPAARRVLVAGVLDPSVLAVRALERHARLLPVEVLVFAPQESHAECFDAWGRAIEEAWLARPIVIPDPAYTIHQGSTPAEQAAVAMELLAEHPHPGDVAAIGIADAEVAAPMEKTLAERGISAYDPAGRRMGTHGVFHLLRIVSRLCASRSFAAAAELMRCPDAAETIRRLAADESGGRPALTRLLDDLDTLAIEALPDTLDDAIELAPRTLEKKSRSPVTVGLAWISAALDRLAGDDFAAALTDFLADVFAARRFRTDRPQDAVFAEFAGQITAVLDAFDSAAGASFSAPLTAADRLELLLCVLEAESFYPERTARAIDLQGWLELLWEDAPHVVVTGMNDGKAPESIVSHPFLPDSARRALGLRHNDTRFARDACVMTALIEQRRRCGGRVDFIFGRIGAAGGPLRPSRLLLQCAEPELPERTLQFFRKPQLRAGSMPWRLAWRLQPRPLPDDAPVFSRLGVTQFRDYLACPFRFYLRHGLRMEEVDAGVAELDAPAFGSLLHRVLEKFAGDAGAAGATDAEEIRAALHRLLDAQLHAAFGPRLTVPVAIQRESARQRLAWWAEVEAEERRKGWRIIAAEARISPDGDPWLLNGMIVSGVVDRIERHPRHGVRLIDFKTYSPSAAQQGGRRSVEDYHLAKLKRTEDASALAPWLLTRNSRGEAARWTDLQLPLYRLAMERRHPGENILTAYATLGKTRADIALDTWPALEGWQLASASACAGGIIEAIRARTFWPPAEKTPYADEFAKLFFGDPLAAVDAGALRDLPPEVRR